MPCLQGFAGRRGGGAGRMLQDPPDLEGAFSLSGSIGSVRQKGGTGVGDTKTPQLSTCVAAWMEIQARCWDLALLMTLWHGQALLPPARPVLG